jgi:predicted nucleotidyltransferase
MQFGLKPETIKKVQSVFAKYPQIEEAILYGSRAMGTYKNGSDIDITLKGEELDIHILSRINNDIDELLLPYKFDLSIFTDIGNKELLAHIERVGKEFYKIK